MINQLIINKTNNTFIQMVRYAFVGGIAFIFDFGMLFVLTEKVHIYYLVSAAISFLFGLSINYFLSLKWVFEKRLIKSKHIEFALFALIGVMGLGLTELFIWLFTEKFGLYYLLSKIVSVVLVYLWNFFARKVVLF